MHTLLLAFQVHVAPLVISHSKIYIAKLFRGLHICILPFLPGYPCSGAFPESIACPISETDGQQIWLVASIEGRIREAAAFGVTFSLSGFTGNHPFSQ